MTKLKKVMYDEGCPRPGTDWNWKNVTLPNGNEVPTHILMLWRPEVLKEQTGIEYLPPEYGYDPSHDGNWCIGSNQMYQAMDCDRDGRLDSICRRKNGEKALDAVRLSGSGCKTEKTNPICLDDWELRQLTPLEIH